MVLRPLSALSAVRKQNLLVEFSSLKYACPHGVFMSLTPGDPTLWSGVLFIRKGPYAPSILRFQISFPPTYPSLPPLITFSTDIFHPLITPLTTYMYTTDIQDSGTVSATDEERLPPGGFSLRDGFPGWFGRGARRSADRERSRNYGLQTPVRGGSGVGSGSETGGSASPTPGRKTTGSNTAGSSAVEDEGKGKISVYEVLRYIRSTFDTDEVLDRVPLEAAGNPGAWHAWRSHRIKSGVLLSPTSPSLNASAKDKSNWHDGLSDTDSNSGASAGATEGYQRLAGATSAPATARLPGEWSWEGVWEVRVKKGINGSVSEAMLYGKEAGDDLIRFLNMEKEEVEGIKERIRESIEAEQTAATRRGVV